MLVGGHLQEICYFLKEMFLAIVLLVLVILNSTIDPIHKWQLFYFCSVIVQISLPSLALGEEFFSV